jgi:hypothetical protein
MRWEYKAKIMKTCALLPAGGGDLQDYSEDVWAVEGRPHVSDSHAD